MNRISKMIKSICLKISRPFVGSTNFGFPDQQVLMFVEVIPREVTDVVRKTLNNITNRGGLIDDAFGYETLNHAVIEAENVGTSLVGYVKTENLLFIFGQTIQSLRYSPIEVPFYTQFLDGVDDLYCHGHNKHCARDNQGQPQARAVVLCKLKHANELELFLAGKEKKGGYGTKSYQITWGELQDLKKRLCGSFGKHKTPKSIKHKRIV
jgi:hypothetical protein